MESNNSDLPLICRILDDQKHNEIIRSFSNFSSIFIPLYIFDLIRTQFCKNLRSYFILFGVFAHNGIDNSMKQSTKRNLVSIISCLIHSIKIIRMVIVYLFCQIFFCYNLKCGLGEQASSYIILKNRYLVLEYMKVLVESK